MSGKVQTSRESRKFYLESHEELESEITSKRTNLCKGENQKMHFPGKVALVIAIHIAMMPLNYLLRKCTSGYKFTKSQEQITHFLYMVIWYQVFLSNTNNFANRSIWPIDGTLTNTITSGQSEPGSNGKYGVFITCYSSRIGALPPDVTHQELLVFGRGVLPLCKEHSQPHSKPHRVWKLPACFTISQTFLSLWYVVS